MTNQPHNLFRPNTNDAFIYQSVYSQNEYRIPLKPDLGGIVIDVGAHIGSFSRLCIERLSPETILAYEPDPSNRIVFAKLLGHVENVKLHGKAVWRSDLKSEMLAFSGLPKWPDGNFINTGGGNVWSEENNHVVAACSLDALLQDLEKVSVLKVDIEGSEWPVMFTSALLETKVEALCGEFHEFSHEIPRRLMVAGYEHFLEEDLITFLKQKYNFVRTFRPAPNHFGLFWAAKDKDFWGF
jgi:FkbM family methyltransferase